MDPWNPWLPLDPKYQGFAYAQPTQQDAYAPVSSSVQPQGAPTSQNQYSLDPINRALTAQIQAYQNGGSNKGLFGGALPQMLLGAVQGYASRAPGPGWGGVAGLAGGARQAINDRADDADEALARRNKAIDLMIAQYKLNQPAPVNIEEFGGAPHITNPDGSIRRAPGFEPMQPNDVQEYEYYAAQERAAGREPLPYHQYQIESKKAGATNVNVGGDGTQYPDPPNDMVWARDTQGNILTEQAPGYPEGVTRPIAIPVQGTKEERDALQADQKARDKAERQGMIADIMTQDIDLALQNSSWWTTGFMGARTKNIEGTPAHDLMNTILGLEANISFDNLNAMRAASPTGGALGPVSDFEIKLLKSAYGSVAQSQSKGQFERNLKRLRKMYEKVRYKKLTLDDMSYDHTEGGSAGAPPGAVGGTTAGGLKWRFE